MLPFLISFLDITIRSILAETLIPDHLLSLSFVLLLVMYSLGYFFLWRHFSQRKELEQQKLLELGTLSIILSDLIIYTSLYQAGNVLSNLIWMGFYLLLIMLLYMLGKRSVNHSETKQLL